MSTGAVSQGGSFGAFEQLRYAREIIKIEGQALLQLADRLDGELCRAVDALFRCTGSVIVTGMGKAGLIGQKISATLASTGTRSHFLHPGEAFHGDLGRIHHSDAVVLLSQSGETEEVTRLLPSLSDFGVPIIAITGKRTSTLGRTADITLDLGPMKEVCSLGLAPSTSTTAMLAMGDALALVVSRMRGFRAEDFARFHPGGSLGRKLSTVDDHFRSIETCRVASDAVSVRDVFSTCTVPGRRAGAIMLTGEDGRLTGIFTDSDLARLFESRREDALDRPIREVMNRRPTTVPTGSMLSDAVEVLAERKISELPVVDDNGKPLGLIDITDIAEMFPEEEKSILPLHSEPLPGVSPPPMRIYPKPIGDEERKP